MKGHLLKILCLRDLQAACECGKWTLVSPAFDHDTDAQIRKRATEQHHLHLIHMRERQNIPDAALKIMLNH